MSICVQKDGKIFTVVLDGIGVGAQPMPVSTYDERPAGSFPATFFSLREVQAKFPGRQLTIVERPPGNGKRIERDPAVAAEAEALMKRGPLANPARVKSKAITPTPKILTSELLPNLVTDSTSISIPPTPSAIECQDKGIEFLKRLETARQYASKKNQRILDLKIEVVLDLLKEVFDYGESES